MGDALDSELAEELAKLKTELKQDVLDRELAKVALELKKEQDAVRQLAEMERKLEEKDPVKELKQLIKDIPILEKTIGELRKKQLDSLADINRLQIYRRESKSALEQQRLDMQIREFIQQRKVSQRRIDTLQHELYQKIARVEAISLTVQPRARPFSVQPRAPSFSVQPRASFLSRVGNTLSDWVSAYPEEDGAWSGGLHGYGIRRMSRGRRNRRNRRKSKPRL